MFITFEEEKKLILVSDLYFWLFVAFISLKPPSEFEFCMDLFTSICLLQIEDDDDDDDDYISIARCRRPSNYLIRLIAGQVVHSEFSKLYFFGHKFCQPLN